MTKSRRSQKRNLSLYIVISVALLPFVLIALAMIYYLLSSFMKTTNAKTIFAKDIPKIVPAVEEYKKLYGYYPVDLKSLDEGLVLRYDPICDGTTDQPMGCTSDKYEYSISSNYDDTSRATDCGYIIVMSQDAIKGLRIIDGYAKLKNVNDVKCLDFVDRTNHYKPL